MRHFALLVLFASLSAQAAETLAPPPPLPEENTVPDSRDALPEPEVTIRHETDRTVEEYRINGVVRYIKVTPNKGKPYYFVDTNGDGILDERFDNLDNPPINQWILLRW
jgi:hypothetical protein